MGLVGQQRCQLFDGIWDEHGCHGGGFVVLAGPAFIGFPNAEHTLKLLSLGGCTL